MQKTILSLAGILALQLLIAPVGAAEKKAQPETVPSVYKVKFETSKGDFVIEFNKAWAPNGVERIHELVKIDFFKDIRFFRVVKDFVVQFGISGDPKISAQWDGKTIVDDPVKESNLRGMVTFAKTGMPNSRSTQLFINLKANAFLDGMGFAPVGRVTSGMDVVDKLYGGYGDEPTALQGQMVAQGNAFLLKQFPNLDYIKKASIVK